MRLQPLSPVGGVGRRSRRPWVEFGTPKQERVCAKRRGKLNFPVLVERGAAFDHTLGTAQPSPPASGGASTAWRRWSVSCIAPAAVANGIWLGVCGSLVFTLAWKF